jgi:hypothetical protein
MGFTPGNAAALRFGPRTGWVGLGTRHTLALGLLLAGVLALPGRVDVAVSHLSSRASSALARMPVALRATASSTLGAQAPSYAVRVQRGALVAAGGGVSATFAAAGPTFHSGDAQLRLSLGAVGHSATTSLPATASPTADGNKVSYRRGALREWYTNGPFGIEQSFTLARRPDVGVGPLTIAIRASGLTPRLAGSEVVFSQAGKQTTMLRYGGLSATDALGHRLPARLAVDGATILLRVADRHARYPLTIDPFVQQGSKLVANDEPGQGGFGYSVALSAGGSTALIGGYSDGSNSQAEGAAWVFTRSSSTWTQQGSKLTANDESGSGFFGWSVALSADGNTALVGGPEDNSSVGAAWVFTRSGTTWTQQGSKLTASDEVSQPFPFGGLFGSSVALSADGNTALIGGPWDTASFYGFQGAAWVFTRSGGTWTQQGSKLFPNDVTFASHFGWSVALSANGNTALIAGPYDNNNKGASWVFTRSGSTWTQQGSKLIGSGYVGTGCGYTNQFGVALSANGNTALVGGWQDNTCVGAAWVFTRSGTTWTQQGSKLTPNDESGAGWFGWMVALSGTGNRAFIAGLDGVWVFSRSGSTWTQQGSKLIGTGGVGYGWYVGSVALSADGHTALAGDPIHGGNVGAVWVFADIPGPKITSFTPSSGKTGDTVTITGSNFTDATSVKFGGTSAGFSVDSDSQITATVPAAATRGKLTVTTAAGIGSSSTAFTVIMPPTITGFTPRSGHAGTTVTITGKGFVGVTAVDFGAAPATSFTVVSETEITAVVAAGSGNGKVTVSNPAGTASSTNAFSM